MEKTFRRGGFTKKLILSMLLVGLLPLIIGLSLAFYLGMQEIREVSGVNFQALAVETARRVDLVVADQQSNNQGITKFPEIIQTLEHIRDQIGDDIPAQVQARLAKEAAAWKSSDSEFSLTVSKSRLSDILTRSVLGSNRSLTSTMAMVARSATRALFVTDILGRVVATTNANISYLHQGTDWWNGAFHQGVGKPFLGNIVFDDRLQTYTFSISMPVMDSLQYQAVGVLHRIYDAKEFFAPSIDLIRFGKTGHVMLIDSTGRVVSCPLLATGTLIPDRQLIPLVTPLEPGWVLGLSDGHGGTSRSIIGFSALPTLTRVMIDSTQTAWHLFVWQSSEELFAPVYHLRNWIIAFGVMSFVLLLLLGILVSRQVVRPLRRLQDAAQRIANRELDEPIVIKTGDEIEELAEELNQMNAQLQAAFSGLTTEVETKTQEVEYLRESTTQVLEGIPDPVLMVDERLDVSYMNLAFKNAVGLTNGWDEKYNLLQLVAPNSHEQQQLRQQVRGLLGDSPACIPGNGGEEIAPSPSLHDPLLQPHTDSPSTNEQLLTIDNRIFRYDWFPIRARPGDTPNYGLVLRDVTDEKRLQDELINSEKSTSLGVLCSGIGHELNNPLVGVIGLAEAIQEEDDVNQAKDHAKAIVRQGHRMAQVIRDLTGQVRSQAKADPIALDLNEQLDLILEYMHVDDEYSQITIEKAYHNLPTFYGLPEEVRLVFFHLIKNAMQSMEGTGRLTIDTQTIERETTEIRIADTGAGIAPHLLPKVFDPFVTTKFMGEGSGLGLTIVQRIVKKYGGRVELDSQEGQGTQCCILFPRQDEPSGKEVGT